MLFRSKAVADGPVVSSTSSSRTTPTRTSTPSRARCRICPCARRCPRRRHTPRTRSRTDRRARTPRAATTAALADHRTAHYRLPVRRTSTSRRKASTEAEASTPLSLSSITLRKVRPTPSCTRSRSDQLLFASLRCSSPDADAVVPRARGANSTAFAMARAACTASAVVRSTSSRADVRSAAYVLASSCDPQQRLQPLRDVPERRPAAADRLLATADPAVVLSSSATAFHPKLDLLHLAWLPTATASTPRAQRSPEPVLLPAPGRSYANPRPLSLPSARSTRSQLAQPRLPVPPTCTTVRSDPAPNATDLAARPIQRSASTWPLRAAAVATRNAPSTAEWTLYPVKRGAVGGASAATELRVDAGPASTRAGAVVCGRVWTIQSILMMYG